MDRRSWDVGGRLRSQFAVFFFLLLTNLWGREPLPEDRGAVGLWQTLQRLGTTARVMHITAHPDDEDGGMLTLLSRGGGVETTLLSLTRGESGANLVTGDFFDALGALRTVELLKAAEYYGVRIRFTRFVDFGYSKSLEETLRNWEREEVLRDVVRIIREERPHVLISRWQGAPRDGHGNHEAAGVIAQLAFDAAGDLRRFPEQIAAGLAVWQPLKLYSDNRRENDEWTLRVDSGGYDPVLGRTYAQMARDGLRYQRSQGAGSALARPGPSVSYYKLLASKVGMAEKETSFLERLDASLSSYADVFRHVEAAVRSFSAANPQACVPALTAGLEAVRHLRRTNRDPDLQTKEDQFLTALEQALGLSFDVLVEPEHLPADPFAQFRPWETFALATPGQTFRSATFFHSSGRAGIKVKDVELMTPPGWSWRRLGENRFEVAVAAEAPATMAYWRRGSIRENLYQIDEPRWFRWPLPPAPVRARLTYFVNGVEASMDREAETSYVDHIGVEHHRALAVGPAVSVRFTSDAGVLPLGQREYSIGCVVRNNFNGLVKGTVWLSLPVGWQSEPGSTPFDFEREKEEANISFRLTAPQGLEAKEYPIEAVASFQGRAYRSSFTAITQPGLETVYLSKPARRQVRGVDVKVAKGMRVGYVMGTGDEVPEGLRQLALPVDLLDSAALPTGDLSRYNTILLGIRAYAARPDVKTYNPRLLEYVRQGGVLIVQYNTQEYDHNYGPFPYTMGANAEEISEEDSPVEILEPSDPVFRFPNRITARDFDGWVEQRGSKFWTTWDAAYRPLLSTHDRGQAPQRGGWLVARHDKGLYIYCAYAWYRQLPFAVPGAFRLFANLVSLGAADAPWRK